MAKMRIDVAPTCIFRNSDGTLNKREMIKMSGIFAGVCYDPEGFEHKMQEPEEKTMKRANDTLVNEHHSVFEHIWISLNLQNIPKILAMVLNNEHLYTTSEKSARYTHIEKDEDSIITEREITLYQKWYEILHEKISVQNELYGSPLKAFKLKTLAQENARYMLSVFMPTQMIYTVSFRQINYIASWMKNYIANANENSYFERTLSNYMKEFLDELARINVLEDGLMQNSKNRSISLFGHDLESKPEYFKDTYSTNYKATFAELAQAQRHRTIYYQMERLDNKEYFIPPVIKGDEVLTREWLEDINSVSELVPQGELVSINEMGTYDLFILKCKERLCSAAQLEIMNQTRDTLLKMKESFEREGYPLASDIVKYSRGARCTFPDYTCPKDCGFNEGKTLKRTI